MYLSIKFMSSQRKFINYGIKLMSQKTHLFIMSIKFISRQTIYVSDHQREKIGSYNYVNMNPLTIHMWKRDCTPHHTSLHMNYTPHYVTSYKI